LVHRTIYQQTPALAVVHCHPRTAIAFSLSRDEIVPIDNEASYLLKKIPVVTEEFPSGTPQMASKVASTLQNYKIITLRGHGSFATGQTLDEAFFWSSTLEEACHIMLSAKLIYEPFIEYRKMSESYNKF
jgi:L-fuculose-phosphate aldolase